MQIRRLSALEMARQRCKKTDKKKDAAYGREGLPYGSMPLGCHQHFGDSIMGQDDSGPKPQE
jgi:hypothetical protein